METLRSRLVGRLAVAAFSGHEAIRGMREFGAKYPLSFGEPITRDAVVPEIWAFEIANVAFVSFLKRKRITEQQICEYLGQPEALPIRAESSDTWANVGLEFQARS